LDRDTVRVTVTDTDTHTDIHSAAAEAKDTPTRTARSFGRDFFYCCLKLHKNIK